MKVALPSPRPPARKGRIMSTETQRAELIRKLQSVPMASAVPSLDDERVMLMVGGYCKKAAAMLEAQAAELAALRADIAEHVRITSEQATEIEALRAAAEKLHLVRIFLLGWKGSEPCKRNNMEQEVERWISAFDELFAAMQTKEAS